MRKTNGNLADRIKLRMLWVDETQARSLREKPGTKGPKR